MARNRTISPTLPHTPGIGRLTREARRLFILLGTQADASGCLRLDAEALVEQLLPYDGDAPVLLLRWLDELEAARCVERYSVGDVAYLRVLGWQKPQKADPPGRRRGPRRRPERKIRERREPREEWPRISMAQGSEADPREDDKKEKQGECVFPTEEQVLQRLENVYRTAVEKGSYASAVRSIELLSRKLNLWPGRRKELRVEHSPANTVLFIWLCIAAAYSACGAWGDRSWPMTIVS